MNINQFQNNNKKDNMSTEQLGFDDKSVNNLIETEKPKSYIPLQKIEEEEDKLILSQNTPQETSVISKHVPFETDNEIIDPIQQLTKKNDIVPLLAVLHLIDLNIEVDGKPLLSKLCTMNIPLAQHLKGREVHFKNDADNRTALHEAIAADDAGAANWCFENGIANVRDNFGNTPILEAIRLGRKNCFLLCLHYNFYDSSAPHFCAIYNRHWELKVLHRLGYDVISIRDSEHFSPLERAVANYSYDAAEYLAEISDNVSANYLATKTDSKGIIRIIEKTKKQGRTFNQIVLPLLFPALQFLFIYYCLNQPQLKFYENYLPIINLSLGSVFACNILILVIGWFGGSKKELSRRDVNILALLKAPEFSVMEEVCPECLTFQNPNKDHCRKCGKCVEGFHYHNISCVNKKNEVFWLFLQIFWFFIIYKLHSILVSHLKLGNLLIFNFSFNRFFGNAAIFDQLLSKDKLMLLWFIFLKVFLVYQFFCCFQWLAMLVLNRTYREINNTEKYKRLYRVVKTSEGNFKSQEIRLMEKGLCLGVISGVSNVVKYFFR